MKANHPDLWANAKINGAEECWPWTGRRAGPGYGAFGGGYAHRAVAELHAGRRLRSREIVRHSCDNRICVNPSHLSVGTQADNIKDCIDRGRFKFLRVERGQSHPSSVLTEAQVREIRASSGPQRIVAERYGIERSTVSAIKRRRIWKHLS